MSLAETIAKCQEYLSDEGEAEGFPYPSCLHERTSTSVPELMEDFEDWMQIYHHNIEYIIR